MKSPKPPHPRRAEWLEIKRNAAIEEAKRLEKSRNYKPETPERAFRIHDHRGMIAW